MCVCVCTYVSWANIQSSSGLVRGLYPDQSSAESSLLGTYCVTYNPQWKWYCTCRRPVDEQLQCSSGPSERRDLRNLLIVGTNGNQRCDTPAKCCHQVWSVQLLLWNSTGSQSKENLSTEQRFSPKRFCFRVYKKTQRQNENQNSRIKQKSIVLSGRQCPGHLKAHAGHMEQWWTHDISRAGTK